MGRRAELDALNSALKQVTAGVPRLLLIEGPPGIGKSALVDRFLAAHRGVRVLRAIGDEAERLLSYGVVEQLARSAGPAGTDLLDRLSDRAAQIDDHLAVAARMLDLLGAIQADGPVALVLDDVQWMDLPSLRAVVFAVRRLLADQVLTLAVVRESATGDLPESLTRLLNGGTGQIIRLSGLSERDLSELSSTIGKGWLSAPEARRLLSGTRGNPLYARAVIEEFPVEEWERPDQALPAPRLFRQIVLRRYAECEGPAQRLAGAAAVLGLRSPLSTAAQLAGVDAPMEALDQASTAELLRLVEGSQPRLISFTHPLVQSAVYEAIGNASRARLHTRAASLLTDGSAVLRHRIAATPGVDEALATDIVRQADTEIGREEWSAAAGHLMLASRLSPAIADQQRRLLRAVNSMLIGGNARAASRFVDQVRNYPPSALRDAVLGYVATANRDRGEAERLLGAAFQSCDPASDPELAATIALQNAIHFHLRLHGKRTVEWGRRAVELASPGTWTRRMAQAQLAYGLGYTGEHTEALTVLNQDQADHLAEQTVGSDTQLSSVRGWLQLLEENLPQARAELSSMTTTALRFGILNTAAVQNVYLARAAYLAGAWDNAVVDADRAIAVSIESASGYLHSLSYSAAVAVPAARGDWGTAQRHLDEAIANTDTYERSFVAVAIAAAQFAAARGDSPAVLAALAPVAALDAAVDGVNEPGAWQWQDLYAEALVADGRIDEANAFLRSHEETAAARDRPAARARLARARGRIEAAAGRPDQARAAFRLSKDCIDGTEMPFERGLIYLAFGQFERRCRQRGAAAALLVAARDQLVSLQADPYVDVCERELAACGVAAGPRQRYREGLTPQETVVARSVVAGRTNREVAADLVVSVKTVEFHLRRIYQKLGVSSRHELAARIGHVDM